MEYRVAVESVGLVLPVTQRIVSWSPTRFGWFKINVDGAIFSAQKTVGLWVVTKDDKESKQRYAGRSQLQWGQLRQRQKHLKQACSLQRTLTSTTSSWKGPP